MLEKANSYLIVIKGKELPIQYNGEFLGRRERVELEVLPKAIKILCPKKPNRTGYRGIAGGLRRAPERGGEFLKQCVVLSVSFSKMQPAFLDLTIQGACCFD
jgi:hypothetical protein